MSVVPNATPQVAPDASKPPKPRMSTRNRLLFFVTGGLIVLMPFLFWWNTWFGRQLSDILLAEYLPDQKHPRHIQHAMVLIGEHITRHDRSVTQWYPQVVRLASDPVEEVRNTDAWVMGQDASDAGFHEALLKMLSDSSPMVRGNAALSLVRFGDATGRKQIVALLQWAHVTAPVERRVVDAGRPGTPVHQGGLLVQESPPGSVQRVESRSPIPGRIRSVVQTGANVA